MGTFFSCRKESSVTIAHLCYGHLIQAQVALLARFGSSSSVPRILTVSCTFRSVCGAGVSLLLPAFPSLENIHLLLLWALLLAVPFSLHCRVLDFPFQRLWEDSVDLLFLWGARPCGPSPPLLQAKWGPLCSEPSSWAPSHPCFVKCCHSSVSYQFTVLPINAIKRGEELNQNFHAFHARVFVKYQEPASQLNFDIKEIMFCIWLISKLFFYCLFKGQL